MCVCFWRYWGITTYPFPRALFLVLNVLVAVLDSHIARQIKGTLRFHVHVWRFHCAYVQFVFAFSIFFCLFPQFGMLRASVPPSGLPFLLILSLSRRWHYCLVLSLVICWRVFRLVLFHFLFMEFAFISCIVLSLDSISSRFRGAISTVICCGFVWFYVSVVNA